MSHLSPELVFEDDEICETRFLENPVDFENLKISQSSTNSRNIQNSVDFQNTNDMRFISDADLKMLKKKRKTERKKDGKAIIYIRVSDVKQIGPGHISLEMQKSMCRKWLDDHNIQLYDNGLIDGVIDGVMADEGKSGKFIESRGIYKLINVLKEGDYIIVYDSTRLTRNLQHALSLDYTFEKKGINFISATQSMVSNTEQSPEARLLKSMIWAMGEFEAGKISDRVTHSLEEKANKGEFVGRIPFGKEPDGKKLIDSMQEQEILKYIYLLRYTLIPRETTRGIKYKGMSYREIADELNNYKYLSPGDKIKTRNEEKAKWRLETVRRHLIKFEERLLVDQYLANEIQTKLYNRQYYTNLSYNISNILKKLYGQSPEYIRFVIWNQFNIDIGDYLNTHIEESLLSYEINIEEEIKKKEEKERLLRNEIMKFIDICKSADDTDIVIIEKIKHKWNVIYDIRTGKIIDDESPEKNHLI